ncbi:DUF4258 domain-containing protein [Polynucleobacter sp. JS-Safj-400b-B2]|uniref:DUF4258 domain-containing protein n=1 Tax=Polynucleobacter sp. JS-Safj-400b-B2 TaxID=2576921 RepID=UPI001C0D0E8A|nr:DUF4258 domain-containing protein [Polynucleobacter sp. JS-Safj-400b-B2]MBU3624947.1 DUF4258 domain-containing protein [Polynucleobacter sp. JS-Safj-400b-B2]
MSKISRAQLQRHIRKAAIQTINVTVTQHASLRMRERHITNSMLFDVLRCGVIKREPEPDLKHSGIKCQMERYSAGMNIAAIVSVEIPSEGLIIITVYEIT